MIEYRELEQLGIKLHNFATSKEAKNLRNIEELNPAFKIILTTTGFLIDYERYDAIYIAFRNCQDLQNWQDSLKEAKDEVKKQKIEDKLSDNITIRTTNLYDMIAKVFNLIEDEYNLENRILATINEIDKGFWIRWSNKFNPAVYYLVDSYDKEYLASKGFVKTSIGWVNKGGQVPLTKSDWPGEISLPKDIFISYYDIMCLSFGQEPKDVILEKVREAFNE